jgi:hypothetical protein
MRTDMPDIERTSAGFQAVIPGCERRTLRRDAVIKRMLATPPKPHSDMKIGKSKAKSGKSQRPKT